MSKIRLYGATSGYIDLAAPAVADDATLTLPTGADGFASEAYVDSAIAAIPGIGSNIVQTVKTDTFSTTSSSYVDVTGLSVTITPSSASSKILLMAYLVTNGNAGSSYGVRVRFNGGNSGTFVSANDSSTARLSTGQVDTAFITPVYLDSPATTSPTTYSVQIARLANATVYVGRGSSGTWPQAPSSLTAIEVAA